MNRYKYIGLIFCLLAFVACKKNSNKSNPFDDWTTTSRGSVMQDLAIDPNTIEGLHKNIFKPTCANSGCHDGNFEPDFRSVESSYNSLLNRMATNTDPQNAQYAKRVVPGDAASSMLLHRLTTFIPGSQGVMPLSLEPTSDWVVKKSQYLENIKNWINDGAKDQFGNSALSTDFPPQMAGIIAFADGSVTPLPHSGYNPIEIPSGTSSIKIMVAYTDDKTPVNQFGTTTLNYSLNPNNYSGAETNMTVESSPFNTKGFSSSNVDYWHSVTLSVSTLGAALNDVLWIRTQTTDKVNSPVYIPSIPAAFNTKKYFSIRIN
ncbi:MAG: hypothetical protein PSX81_15250 [bacterium]|nr:hypothetical protein [bacterium]